MRRFSDSFWGGDRSGRTEWLCGPKFELPQDAAGVCAEPPDESASTTVVRTLHPAGRPVGLFVPEGYEPNYAYPLIVWLHEAGGSESGLAEVMQGISTRNYFGLSLRGSRALPRGGYDWPAGDYGTFGVELQETICRLRREYNIHGERIVVAGAGSGGTLALTLLLRRPEWFVGAVSLGGSLREPPTVPNRIRDVRGRRVLLAAGAHEAEPLAEMVRAARVLRSAGIDVATKVYDSAERIPPRLFSFVNRWVMADIVAAA